VPDPTLPAQGADDLLLPGLHFLKGHGTGNDFVVLPDPDGELQLTPRLVQALCDRHRGIGADGVLRVVRSRAAGVDDLGGAVRADDDTWFMDYHNADGSVSEMCGNGVRVYARYLVDAGLAEAGDMAVDTRAGLRAVHVPADPQAPITVDMGAPVYDGQVTKVRVEGAVLSGDVVSMGNPHVVCAVDDLAGVGPLLVLPEIDSDVFPTGANVEFVVRRGPRHIEMRVHERGVGETLSCGTGACAAVVASAGSPTGQEWAVDVPGGRLGVTWSTETVLLSGPAALIAEGRIDLSALLKGDKSG
jgi:diaminopimelate epimerase